MPSRHNAEKRRGKAFPFAGLILSWALLAAVPLSAQENRIYTDLLCPVSGLFFGAVHLRAGLESLIVGRASWGVEAEFYYSSPLVDSFVQADALFLVRFRPSGRAATDGGLYAGAGLGLGWSSVRPAGMELERLAGILAAEAGWSMRLFASHLYLEPFVRGFIVAPSASDDTIVSAGAELGLRLGWIFDSYGRDQ